MPDDAPIELPAKDTRPARYYALLCLLMLLLMTAQLTERVPGVWGALPLLFGAAMLVTQWREGPVLVLLFVALLLILERFGGDLMDGIRILSVYGFRRFERWTRSAPGFNDFVLAGAYLVYTASYYRYLGIARNLFPPDPRVRPYSGLPLTERRRLVEEPQRRSDETVTAREFMVLAVGVPVCLAGAAVLWNWTLSGQEDRYSYVGILWSVFQLTYLFGIPLLLFRAVVAYSTQLRSTEDECLTYLQDRLWRETRREQSRSNRWLTWARLRAQRRKEK